jgi:DNA-binding CsgD family transcriptional regulator
MQIIGREPELAVLREFLGAESRQRAFVLTGGPGIGKTTLWEAGVAGAGEQRMRVLTARPRDAEAQHSFSGLADLLDDVGAEALAGIPTPQLRALEVALLRAEPTRQPPEPRAIGLGLLNALSTLALSEPVLVAVDDVQWLDPASTEAVAFVARRLRAQPIRFLLAKRARSSSVLERALGPRGLQRLEVGPLSLGTTRRLLSERLGLSLPRQVLRRIFEATLGNPLFALEVGRTLAERGPLEIGEDIPVPDLVEDLLGTRVARLPGPIRRLLLAVALSSELRADQVAAIADPAALDDAIDAGVLLLDENRVRPSHPLLAAAAKKRSRARERRELHLELAGVVADEELRALHLALATELPDDELAATVAAAAAGASARGAVQDAVVLAEHAFRLTPQEGAERTERLLALADYLGVAGDPHRVTELLTPELESLPSGAPRVRAQLLLSDTTDVVSIADHLRHFDLALAESGNVAVLRSPVLAKKSVHTTAVCLERIGDAESWALEALAAGVEAGPAVEREALYALGWARGLRGKPIDDVCERFRVVSDAAFYLTQSPVRVAGQRLLWRGEIDRGRTYLTRLLSIADERGESSYAVLRLHLCELELRGGDWDEASRLLDDWEGSPEGELLVYPMYERCRALLAAGRGIPDEAERWAAEAIARAEDTVRWDILEASRARGVAALLAHEPARAVESLREVWAHTEREGVEEPGVFPVAPELVEALIELGEHGEAQAVAERLAKLATEQEHPWGLATAKRCAALLRLASPLYDEEAAAELAEAAAAYGELGLRFDRARSVLSLGRAQRRLRKWGAARRSLEEAAAAFDEIGSSGWAEAARSELTRVGARRPPLAGELTKTEQRVAELAAAGLANKQIAQDLFVSVKTVEAHLSHAYTKLGIRSRAQLARRLFPSG